MKDLTIIIPLFNKVKYIKQCLDSFKSTIKNCDWECIVVDDGSYDGSTFIAKQYCNNNTDNFTYVQVLRNHALSPSYARNIGIRLADSEFLMFFDADDTVCEGYIDRGVEFMKNNPDYSWYGEGFYVIKEIDDNNYEHFETYYPIVEDLTYKDYIMHGGGTSTRGIFRTEEVKKHRYKDTTLEDCIFMLDYLYPDKKFMQNNNEMGFNYYTCRCEQVYVNDKIVDDMGMNDRQFMLNYVRDTYPEYYYSNFND